MSGIRAVEMSWQVVLDTFSDYQLKSGVTFALHEAMYWGSYLLYFICDAIPALQRWKIQADKPNTRELQTRCLWRVLANHLLLVLPLILLTHPVLDLLGMQTSVASLPTAAHVAAQVFFFFFVEDIVFYWGHRALHTPYLYRNIHVIHHHHSAPFGMAAEYAHPIEVIFLGTATIIGPLILPPHLFTLYVYLALRCLQTVDCHSGYDFPWGLRKYFPLYGGAFFHDHHHRIHSGNYSSTFVWVDWLFGTDHAFMIWKRKQTGKSVS